MVSQRTSGVPRGVVVGVLATLPGIALLILGQALNLQEWPYPQLIGALGALAFYGAPVIAGVVAARRSGKVGDGALAGFISSALVGGVGSILVIVIISLDASVSDKGSAIVVYVLATLLTIAFCAGLGALGGLFGAARHTRRHATPVAPSDVHAMDQRMVPGAPSEVPSMGQHATPAPPSEASTKATIRALSVISLVALLVAGSCATYFFTLPADTPGYAGGGFLVGCIGLPLLLLSMLLGAIASIRVAVNASKQSQGAWRFAAIVSALFGVLWPIVLIAGQIAAQLFLPPDAVVNSPAVTTGFSLLALVPPVGMSVVALAHARTMPAQARPTLPTPPPAEPPTPPAGMP